MSTTAILDEEDRTGSCSVPATNAFDALQIAAIWMGVAFSIFASSYLPSIELKAGSVQYSGTPSLLVIIAVVIAAVKATRAVADT